MTTFGVKLQLQQVTEMLQEAQNTLVQAGDAYEANGNVLKGYADGSSNGDGAEAAAQFASIRQELETATSHLAMAVTAIETYDSFI